MGSGARDRVFPVRGGGLLTLPRIAASRKRCWRFSAVVAGASKGGRRIDNPPQVKNLPHNSSRRAKNVMDSSTRPRRRACSLRAGLRPRNGASIRRSLAARSHRPASTRPTVSPTRARRASVGTRTPAAEGFVAMDRACSCLAFPHFRFCSNAPEPVGLRPAAARGWCGEGSWRRRTHPCSRARRRGRRR
jgi:hypothetical protein